MAKATLPNGQVVDIDEKGNIINSSGNIVTGPTTSVNPNVQSIQNVFGSSWSPSAAFTPQLQSQGIYGAVRIAGQNDVYTLGPGGTKETAESYAKKFGSANQTGIVGEVSLEQASKLGIITTPTEKTPSSTADLGAGQTSTYTPPQTTSNSIVDSYSKSLLADLDAKNKALTDAYNTQLANTQKQKDDAQKKMDDLLATQKDILETDVKPLTEPFRADIEAAERQRLAVEENFQANQALTNELGTLLTQIQTDLQSTKDVTGLAAIRDPRIAKATEQASARVGVIEAVMAARNNQISVAENMIDRTVTAMTSDRQDQLNYYNSLLDFYSGQITTEGNKIINLTEQEQGWIKAKVGMLESDLTNAQANADYIKNLMINPDTAQAMGQAGVTLNDSPEVINQKLTTYAYSKELKDTSNTMTTNGYKSLLPQEVASKPANEVITTTDSKGNTSYWWKAEKKTTTGTTSASTSPLSVLDLERLKELYPGVEINPGDSLATVTARVAALNAPKEYTDEQLRQIASANKSAKNSYEDAIAGIDQDATIKNKDRAKFIVAEIYGKAGGKTFDEWMGKTTTTTTPTATPSQTTSGLTPAGNGYYWTPDGDLLTLSEWNEQQKTKGQSLINK